MKNRLNLWLQTEHAMASIARGDATLDKNWKAKWLAQGRIDAIEDMLKEVNK